MILISVVTESSTITLATTEDVQAISSPNYPIFYTNELNITFIIYSPVGTHVKLVFMDLVLEYTYDYCYYDEFIIYEGK